MRIISVSFENSESETTAFGLNGMLVRDFVRNNNGAAVLSSGLHVSNDFLLFTIPGREIVFVQRMLVKGKCSV